MPELSGSVEPEAVAVSVSSVVAGSGAKDTVGAVGTSLMVRSRAVCE